MVKGEHYLVFPFFRTSNSPFFTPWIKALPHRVNESWAGRVFGIPDVNRRANTNSNTGLDREIPGDGRGLEAIDFMRVAWFFHLNPLCKER